MEKQTQKRVPIPTGAVSKLMIKYRVSQPTIWAALNYRTNSELAIEIREYAIKEWGDRPLKQNNQ